MTILWIATKAPWPLIDGGRLVMKITVQALADLGHRVTLVAPVAPGQKARAEEALAQCCRPCLVATRGIPLPVVWIGAQLSGRALSVARHSRRGVRRRVARLLREEDFDVIHVEQVQAMAQAAPGLEAGVPVVVRAQNVESDLWRGAGEVLGWARPLLSHEAGKLAEWERWSLQRASLALALTPEDADRLAGLAGRPVETLRAPFPSTLKPGGTVALAGSPPVVLLGAATWAPNRDAASWFVKDVWPAVRESSPEAVLHLFGTSGMTGDGGSVVSHSPLAESWQAFPPGAVLVVPLRVGSGVRMKILEAWARGVPVVATPQAASGLVFEEGRELLLARDGEGFANAIRRLRTEPRLRDALVAAGRRTLERHHGVEAIARRLAELYAQVVGARGRGIGATASRADLGSGLC